MAHGSGVIMQLAEPEPDPVTMTSSVIPWAVPDRGGNRGQSVVQGPRGAHKGPAHKGPGGPTRAHGGATRARPTRAQGAHKGPAHKGPGGPQGPGPQGPRWAHKGPRARPTRAQGIVASWQGHRARAKAATRIVVHKGGGIKDPVNQYL